jgi:hypothetical protein
MASPMGERLVMTTPTSPIFVIEGFDVSIYASVEDAERHLESPDILDNRYVAYDSEGRLLILKAPRPKTRKFFGIQSVTVDKINISCDESQPLHSEALKKELKELLKHFGVSPAWLEKAPLKDLVTKSIEQVGFTK